MVVSNKKSDRFDPDLTPMDVVGEPLVVRLQNTRDSRTFRKCYVLQEDGTSSRQPWLSRQNWSSAFSNEQFTQFRSPPSVPPPQTPSGSLDITPQISAKSSPVPPPRRPPPPARAPLRTVSTNNSMLLMPVNIRQKYTGPIPQRASRVVYLSRSSPAYLRVGTTVVYRYSGSEKQEKQSISSRSSNATVLTQNLFHQPRGFSINTSSPLEIPQDIIKTSRLTIRSDDHSGSKEVEEVDNKRVSDRTRVVWRRVCCSIRQRLEK